MGETDHGCFPELGCGGWSNESTAGTGAFSGKFVSREWGPFCSHDLLLLNNKLLSVVSQFASQSVCPSLLTCSARPACSFQSVIVLQLVGLSHAWVALSKIVTQMPYQEQHLKSSNNGIAILV